VAECTALDDHLLREGPHRLEQRVRLLDREDALRHATIIERL
jgi:hypothetical protein